MARSSIAACGSENLLLDSQRARQALEASERLCVVIEQCLVDIIRIRHIFRDFFAWLVWRVLSVKAEGTTVDSSERQHAMQKRPPQAVRERVASFLSDAGPRDNPDSGGQASETESLVGLRLSVRFVLHCFIIIIILFVYFNLLYRLFFDCFYFVLRRSTSRMKPSIPQIKLEE